MRNILAAQHGRLALFLPVFMGAGIALYFARATEPSLVWSVVLAIVAAGAGVWWRRAPLLCLAFAATGFALACFAASRAPPWLALPRHAVEAQGPIAAIDILPAGRRLTLFPPSLDVGQPLRRSLRIRLRNTDQAVLAVGDIVRVRCLLQAPAPPDYPGGRDTQREAFFAGLGGYGFAIGPVAVLHRARSSLVFTLRGAVARRILTALPGPRGAIAATLLTGLGTAIPPADRVAFEASGLAHLLAVAGLHIGIVMGLVFAAARLGLAALEYPALAWPTRKIAASAALAAGFCYLMLTGGHLPIMRSFAMAALVTLGVLTGRRALSLRGLALAAMLLMLIAPESVMGVSFQMSFAAVLCLIAGNEAARPWLRHLQEHGFWRRPLAYAAGLALCSLLAGTAALPFAAYHFGRATLYYVPANLLAVPLTAFWVMPWGLLALALMPVGLDSLALVPMGWGIDGLIAIAHAVAAWPDANLPVPQSPPWALALVAAGLAWGGLLHGKIRLAALAPLVAGLGAPFLLPTPDILVGPDAKVVALRLGDLVAAETGPAATPYETEAPLRLWGVPTTTDFLSSQAGLICDAASCRATLRGRPVLVIRATEAVDCRVSVIVSSSWLHDACPDTLVIDRAFLRREGATTIRLAQPFPVVRTDLGTRGTRPWVIQASPPLPMAETE